MSPRFLAPTLLALFLIPAALHAQDGPGLVEIGANDFRISDAGTDGNTLFGAFGPNIAYNPNANEYFLVWMAEEETDGEFEIYGQRLDAATGAEIGENDFRISTTGTDGDPDVDAVSPDIVYNPIDDTYLVVWESKEPPEINASEVYAQRLTADGIKIGGDFRISDAGPDSTMFFRTGTPKVVHNPTVNEYLVVWSGDDGDTVDDLDTEIRGQRLDATGTEVGENDFRISDLGPDGNGSFFYGAFSPSVVYNPSADEYLVVWEGGDVDEEQEVFGQRLNAAGAEIGENDFRISDMGPDGNTSYETFSTDLTYNAARNEYLVVWSGEDFLDGRRTGYEIFGQLLDATGTEVGPNDIRISDMGAPGDQSADAAFPAVAAQDEVYVVVWAGNEVVFSTVYGLYGQLIEAATGIEVGTNDVLLSELDPDSGQGDVSDPRLVRNIVNGEYLVAWDGRRPAPEPAEFEIFGQRLAVSTAGTPAEADAPLRGFTLDAYPNPFRSTARFSLTVAEAQPVRAEVFDALGRRVAVLHDGPFAAGTAHTLVLDGSGLPSGVYLVRVVGDTFADTRRIVLVR